jgi:hypothetical protein
VAVHFHPDRIAADGRVVVERLLDDGVYRSQFETRISVRYGTPIAGAATAVGTPSG